MDASFIDETLRLGEDSTTEFKGVAKNNYKIDSHDLAKGITALANARGGRLSPLFAESRAG